VKAERGPEGSSSSGVRYLAIPQEAPPHLAVPLGDAAYRADFVRSGSDLSVDAGPDGSVVIAGYFTHPAPPALVTQSGGLLPFDLVTSLARAGTPVQLAQAGTDDAGASDAGGGGLPVIGEIVELEGTASVVRGDGSLVALSEGAPVRLGDLVETGPASALGIRFEDGTAFSLSANARMTLDELIYDPAGQSSMTASVLSGTFGFVTGQIASLPDSEGMTVRTPVATIGIRGTTVSGQIEEGLVTLLPDPGTERTGRVVVVNLGGQQELDQPYQSTRLVSFFEAPSTPYTLSPGEALALYNSVLPTLREILGAGFGEEEDASGQPGEEQGGALGEEQFAELARILGALEPGAGGPAPGDAPPTITQANVSVVEVEALVVQVVTGTLAALGRLESRADGQGGAFDANLFSLDDLERIGEQVQAVTGTDGSTGSGAGVIAGTSGNDVLFGTGGDDAIDGAGGNDSIFGGAGDDVIVGSPGNDVIDGGPGTDTVTFSGPRSDYTIYLGDLLVVGPSGDRTLVRNVERLLFQDRSLTVPEAESEAAPLALATLASTSVSEGGQFELTVRLTKAASTTLTFGYKLLGLGASLSGDLDAANSAPFSGQLVFAPGQTVKTLRFATLEDQVFEANETLQLVLTAPGGQQVLLVEALGGQLETQAAASLTKTLTIVNDDPAVPETFVWSGAGDGSSFGDPANWQSGQVPVAGKAATIPSGAAAVYSSGTLALESLTVQGSLTVGGGSLQVNAPSVAGDGTLTLTGGTVTTNAGTFALVDTAVSGGSLKTGGTGTLRLDGATLTGTEVLNGVGGTLQVQGTTRLGGLASPMSNGGTLLLAAGATLILLNEGFVNAAGATLAGTGTLQASSVENAGTLAPGESLGTVTVSGAFSQVDSGTLALEIGDDGQSDTLQVNGAATLDGTLALTALAGATPDAGQTYTLASASDGLAADDDGLTGLFDSVTTDGFAALLTTANGQLQLEVLSGSTLAGTDGDDILVGTDGNEILSGGEGADLLFGGGGDDFLDGGAGADRLVGGDGDDRLYGRDGADRLEGDAGADSLYGGGGTDRLYGGSGADRLDGGDDTDRLYGGLDADRLYGGGGADSLYGDAGADTLFGGDGGDLLYGGADADTLYGDAGADSLYGGDGDDVLDAASLESGASSLTIDASNVTSTGNGFTVTARNLGDSGILGPPSADNLTTDNGIFGFGVDGEAGDTAAQLGYDEDTEVSEQIIVELDQDAIRAVVDVTQLFDNHGEIGRWTAYSDETQVGTATFLSDDGASSTSFTIAPGQAFDRLVFTAEPRDTSKSDGDLDGSEYFIQKISLTPPEDGGVTNLLVGGAGNDSLTGAAGDDVLEGGPGTDVLLGDSGADTFYFAGPQDGTFQAGNGVAASGVAGDSLGDFQAGVDTLQLGGGFGFSGSLVAGATFVKLAEAVYDGTNGAGAVWSQASDAAKASVLIVDAAGNIVHDDNGGDAGYTVVAKVSSATAAALSDSDVQIGAVS
jgi:Ca2+-binding RTX toxin-like protein